MGRKKAPDMVKDQRASVEAPEWPPWHSKCEKAWGDPAYHVVCIYRAEKRSLKPNLGWLYGNRRIQTRLSPGSQSLCNTVSARLAGKFREEASCGGPEGTGILLQQGSGQGESLYLLTAGHIFNRSPEDYTFLSYHFGNVIEPLPWKNPEMRNNWWKFRGAYDDKRSLLPDGDFALKAKKDHWVVSYGGAQTEDFAIVELEQKSSEFLQGYVIGGSWQEPELEQTLRYYMFPNGLGMKVGTGRYQPTDLGKIWEGASYVFSPLQVTSGCSGAPILLRDDEGKEHLWGMVVGKGNTYRDFRAWENGSVQWQLGKAVLAGQNGTKILKLSAIHQRLQEIENGNKWHDPRGGQKQGFLKKLLELFPQDGEGVSKKWKPVFADKKESSRETWEGELVGDNSLRFEGTQLVSERGSETVVLADLMATEALSVLVYREASSRHPQWKVWEAGLDCFFENTVEEEDCPVIEPLLKYPPALELTDRGPSGYSQQARWPWINTQTYPESPFRLGFVEDLMDVYHYSDCQSFPIGTQTAALQGLGTIDWVDELPTYDCQRMQTFWINEDFLLEFKLDPNDDSVILIRTVDGLVDIHAWAFKV